MGALRMPCNALPTFAAGLFLSLGAGNGVFADPPAGTAAGASGGSSSGDAPKSLPQENFFSSIKQSLRMGYDHEVVRGHFELGSPPNPRRYYCLVDTKTGSREPNGVLGEPVPLADGTTGLKIDSVSLYGCDKAEQQGMLVTAGYRLNATIGGGAANTPAQPPAAPPQSATPARPPAQAQGSPEGSPDKIDVAGVTLGMSPDEVRAVLKAKKLREYTESAETLGYLDSAQGAMLSIANGRFVNVIAAWTAPDGGDDFAADGESYEVMFTPVPGRERAMAVVHSVGYSPANAILEVALENGLIKKYGGFAELNSLPDSPTWRFQSRGTVQVGDSCNRRGLFGGLGRLNVANPVRENLALKSTADEFRSQLDHCGIAIVTEDHVTANGGALRGDRLVTQFTVTAYGPAIALEGANAAAQLIQAARGVPNKADVQRAKDQAAPNL
jgi:hypothetical protein